MKATVTDITTAMPHGTARIQCRSCFRDFVSVAPVGVKAIECPGCGNMLNHDGEVVHSARCVDCGSIFTVCPKPDDLEKWDKCLSEDCSSYDPDRDADGLFGK